MKADDVGLARSLMRMERRRGLRATSIRPVMMRNDEVMHVRG